MQQQASNDVLEHNHDDRLIKRGLFARILHATIFEVIAIILTALFLVVIEGKSLVSMGVLSIIISLIATAWNGIFNFAFDQLQKKYRFSRSKLVRFLHALGFEGGLLIFTLPCIAFYLNISLWYAFVLDIGLLLFFLPYSIIFNYIYDKIYLHFTAKS
ncbi:PACE efflux transporter [Bartonella sp. HY038]|uniref:PACE efflux transporter n=1 Tax=Bartonella sp. HY038 TaxID=2759660 RepID=UPI001AEE8F0A|nr:PACE efflux transporter [Bartonella sp. HY038]